MIKLGIKSQTRLMGVHPKLVIFTYKVMDKMQKRQLSDRPFTDFGVFEGVRSYSRQKNLLKKGYTKTLDSYHLYGLAVDLVVFKDNKFTWDNKKYEKSWQILTDVCNEVIKETKTEVKHPFSWDLAHYQLTGFKPLYDIRKILKDKIC